MDGYKSSLAVVLDTSEIERVYKNINKAIAKGTTRKDIVRQISPTWILWKYGAPAGIMTLMSHTPVGDDFSNWGYWDYGSYVLYGEDHAKGTLRRGWFTADPAEAESNTVLPETKQAAWDFVEGNCRVHKSRGYSYYIDLVNCVPYGVPVEYGHKVVFPGEAHRHYFEVGGAKPTGSFAIKGSGSVGACRWVPGKFFVKQALSKSNWQPVLDTMHAEYVKRFRMVFK